MKWKEDHEIG